MELLYGLPMRGPLDQADRLAVGVHVYVPYGKAYLPYALSESARNPRIAWWLVHAVHPGSPIEPAAQEREPELARR